MGFFKKHINPNGQLRHLKAKDLFKDNTQQVFDAKDKFVIWDILVWDGIYLIGKTLQERLQLLENIYPCKRAVISKQKIEIYDHLCCTEHAGIYKAPTYLNNFEALYNDIVKTDLYEGLILKKIDSKLTFGFNEMNNHDWQLKCRKETKIYNF